MDSRNELVKIQLQVVAAASLLAALSVKFHINPVFVSIGLSAAFLGAKYLMLRLRETQQDRNDRQ